jgi:hypothetical protein
MTNNPQSAPPIKIAIEEDSASFAKVEQRTADTFNRINALAKANDAVAQSAQQMGRSLADAFALSATKVDDNIRQVQDLRKQVQGLGEDSDKASKIDLGIGGLRRTGGALSQLGMGEIGGAVSRVGDIAQVGKELGEVGGAIMALEAPLGAVLGVALPVVAAVAAVAIVLQSLQAASEEALKQEKADFEFRKGELDEDQRVRVEKRTRTKAANDAEIADLNKQIADTDRLKLELVKQRNALPGYSPGLATDQQGDPKVQQLNKQIQELTDKSTALSHQLGIDVMQLDPVIKQREEETQAVKDYSDSLSRSIQMTDLAATGTKKQVDDRIRSLTEEKTALRNYLEFFPESLRQTEAGAALYKELSDKLKNVNAELGQLKDNVKPIVDARTAIDEFFKKIKGEADRISKEVNERNARVASVQQKYETDVATIEEQSLQKRADIEKKYADRQIEIAQQAADAAASALAKLQQQRDDLATSLGRDQQKTERDAQAKVLDIQISAQREEVKALRDHQRELEQIRKDAYAREVGFLLDRNFLGLYESRLNTSRSIDSSNEKFSASQEDRQRVAQQQIEDLKRSVARERQERLIAYQQQLADAQLSYRREIQAAQQKRVQELSLARQTEQAALREAVTAAANELRIRQNAYSQELKLAALYGAARVKAEDDIQKALIKRAEQYLSLINGSSGGANTPIGGDQRRLLQRAGGGPLGAGQQATVNERGRESFNGVPFPSGLGIFTALQSGTVSPGQTGPITLNVYPSPGMDETQLAHKTLDLIEKVIGK